MLNIGKVSFNSMESMPFCRKLISTAFAVILTAGLVVNPSLASAITEQGIRVGQSSSSAMFDINALAPQTISHPVISDAGGKMAFRLRSAAGHLEKTFAHSVMPNPEAFMRRERGPVGKPLDDDALPILPAAGGVSRYSDIGIHSVEMSARLHHRLIKTSMGWAGGEELHPGGFKTLNEVSQYTPTEMLRIINFGQKTLDELEALLFRNGLSLKGYTAEEKAKRMEYLKKKGYPVDLIQPPVARIFRQPTQLGFLSDSSSVEELEISVRLYNGLKNKALNTIGQICEHTRNEMIRFKNFSRPLLDELEIGLAQGGRFLPGRSGIEDLKHYLQEERGFTTERLETLFPSSHVVEPDSSGEDNAPSPDSAQLESPAPAHDIEIKRDEMSARLHHRLIKTSMGWAGGEELHPGGFKTLNEVSQYTPTEMLRIINFGQKTLDELEALLFRNGLSLKGYTAEEKAKRMEYLKKKGYPVDLIQPPVARIPQPLTPPALAEINPGSETETRIQTLLVEVVAEAEKAGVDPTEAERALRQAADNFSPEEIEALNSALKSRPFKEIAHVEKAGTVSNDQDVAATVFADRVMALVNPNRTERRRAVMLRSLYDLFFARTRHHYEHPPAVTTKDVAAPFVAEEESEDQDEQNQDDRKKSWQDTQIADSALQSMAKEGNPDVKVLFASKKDMFTADSTKASARDRAFFEAVNKSLSIKAKVAIYFLLHGEMPKDLDDISDQDWNHFVGFESGYLRRVSRVADGRAEAKIFFSQSANDRLETALRSALVLNYPLEIDPKREQLTNAVLEFRDEAIESIREFYHSDSNTMQRQRFETAAASDDAAQAASQSPSPVSAQAPVQAQVQTSVPVENEADRERREAESMSVALLSKLTTDDSIQRRLRSVVSVPIFQRIFTYVKNEGLGGLEELVDVLKDLSNRTAVIERIKSEFGRQETDLALREAS